MTTSHRIVLATAALAGAAALVLGLTAFNIAFEGPLGSLLERVATAVRTAEHRGREVFVGPGRRRHLAWFEPLRTDRTQLADPPQVLFGAYADGLPESLDGVRRLEQALGTTLPLVQIYVAWGDRVEQAFPHRVATTIWNMGSVPLITWEPWLATFDNVRHPFLPLREKRDLHGLAAVAAGDYDFYVDRWAAAAAAFGHPVFIRFAHEMNDPYRYPWGPQHNTKEEFIAAWRHVVQRFRAAGAGNVIWVWSPHVAYEYWDLYYPGDGFVDWAATGVLNFGPIAQWSKWWTFDEIFGSKYERLAAFGRPLMIAEFGSLAVGGDRAEWYRSALEALPARYPAVRALLFFEVGSDQTVTYQKVDWTIADDADVVAAIESLIPNPRIP
jgi:hypothetical protein